MNCQAQKWLNPGLFIDSPLIVGRRWRRSAAQPSGRSWTSATRGSSSWQTAYTSLLQVLKGQCHEKKKKLRLSGWVVALGLNKRPWILCKKSLWNLWYDLRFFGHILLRLGCHFWNAPLSICLHHFYHNLIFKTILLNQNDRTQCKSCHIVQYSQSYYERFSKFFLFWEKTDVLYLHEILDQIVTFYWNVNFLQVFNQFIFKPYETEYTSTR